jgi:hypothetical protein
LQEFELQIVPRKEEPPKEPRTIEVKEFNENISTTTLCILPENVVQDRRVRLFY